MSDKPEGQDPMEDHRLVCGGLRYGRNGLSVALFPEGQYEPGSERLYTARKAFRHMVVGGIYLVPATPDLGTVRLQAKWAGRLDNDELVSAWQLTSSAASFQAFSAKEEKADRDHLRRSLERMLEPIRREYAEASITGRLAIEVELLRALRYAPSRRG